MSNNAPSVSVDVDAQLAELAASFYDDPYGFVMAAYPWGEPTLPDGSRNPLADKAGPEPWQEEFLRALGDHIRENTERKKLDLEYLVWRSAVASGHGVGKSTLVAWLIHFFMTTRVNTRGVTTANTQSQLETKTWPELAKWHKLFLFKSWFTWTSTAYYFSKYPEDQRKNYMVNAATVSKDNTEAFAGMHNEGRTVFAIFDEASGIEEKVFEVADGATTDGEAFLFMFGNPSRPDGYFADCFDRYTMIMTFLKHVDSRTVSHTNKQALLDIINKYGGDDGENADDAVKVRVLGRFPNQSFNGFIGIDVVNDAIQRELFVDSNAALVMGVDVARYGDDETVIGFRQGRDARSRPFYSFKGLNNVKVADLVAFYANRERPDAICIEGVGPGVGVIDILRSRGYKVIEVHPGAPSAEPMHYVNKRAEMWSKLRDWLVDQGCIADDKELYTQLTTILYTLDRHEQRVKLEAKEDMKVRTGLSSPDRADTLALTFAVHIARRDANLRHRGPVRSEAIHEYDVLAH